jgi:murein DD-endopeptidase MepM/ murein hydrolase activator NlpD
LQGINVQKGQQVSKGQDVATMGNSGATYSPSGKGDGTHLDYRIVTAFGKYKNPMKYLQNL